MIFECIGKRSEKPYIIKDTRTGIYSLEELFYYIRENVFMLDPEDFGSGLARFLRSRLDLPEMADKYEEMLAKEASFADRICMLFSESRYSGESEVETIRKALNMSEHMSYNDSHRVRADFFFKSSRLPEAVIEYKAALSLVDREQNPYDAARLLTGLGNTAGRMFKFDSACKYFEEAAELNPGDPGIVNKYIVAARLAVKGDGFFELMKEKNIPEDIYVRVLERMKEAEKKAMRRDDARSLKEGRKQRTEGNYNGYVTLRNGVLNDWKNRYRNTGG